MAKGPADAGLDTFKTLVFDPLVKGVIEKITASAGWLSFGPVAFIVSKLVTAIANALYDKLKLVINFQYIALLNEKHHKAYVEANTELRLIAKSQGINSPYFLEAREKRKKALALFVRSTLE